MWKKLNVTALLLLLLTATGGGLLIYHESTSPERVQLRSLEAQNFELQKSVEIERQQKEEFKKFVQRLKATQPVAEIVVRDPVYSESAPGGVQGEYLVFTELDENGNELNSKEFWIEGKRAHLDAEVIKFDSSFVEQGDPMKGRNIVLFRSLYDQVTPPGQAHEIDKEGQIPAAYHSDNANLTATQQGLWNTFLKLVQDPDYRKSMGVRVAQGEGVWSDFEFGYKYRISVDANGGPNIVNEKLPAGIINALKSHEAANAAPATRSAAAQ